ncbi:MAG TPA: tetratricopeptide repeat protein [Candidatus Acidoferrum sp.]|nr:tetratricopeptide repeat protein [Candidatus Acidoferrum sp.]
MLPAALLLLSLAPQTASSAAAQHVHAGIEADQQGHIDQAIAEFKEATEEDPKLASAFLDLGQAYVEKHDYASAIPPLKRALELDPSIRGGHELLGYSLLAQGYADEAASHFEKAHDTAALGISLVEAGRPADAIPYLKEAVSKNPDDPDLLYYLGRAAGLLSRQAFDALESRFPDSARAHQMMAQNYAVLRDEPNAEKEYKAALQAKPDILDVHMELGQVYARAQQWDKAEGEFRIEAQMQPGNAEAFYRLGDALLQQGKVKDARVALERSDKLRPNMPQTLYNLGKAASLDNDPASAEKYWLRVLAVEKGTPLAAQSHFGLATIYRREGKQAEAARQMQEYEKLQIERPSEANP